MEKIRISKKPDERRLEIIKTAEKMFQSIGYEKTAINMVTEKIGIAKGTFYYYFKSKEELLSAVADHTLIGLIERAEKISMDKKTTAIKKMEKIFSGEDRENKKAVKITKSLHQPENRTLHEEINVQIVVRFSPLVNKIIKKGNKDGSFKNSVSLETVQFLLAGSQFLFDEGLFSWNKKEWMTRRKAMQEIFETVLGSKKGAFSFILKNNH